MSSLKKWSATKYLKISKDTTLSLNVIYCVQSVLFLCDYSPKKPNDIQIIKSNPIYVSSHNGKAHNFHMPAHLFWTHTWTYMNFLITISMNET